MKSKEQLETLAQHRLSQAQKKEFEETGLLTIENAISQDMVQTLTKTVDRIHKEKAEPGKYFFRPNCVVDDP